MAKKLRKLEILHGIFKENKESIILLRIQAGSAKKQMEKVKFIWHGT